MQASREQGKVVILMPCQTHDPAKGSFMVHALAVKKPSGTPKTVPNPFYDPYDPDSEKRLNVFRAAHHRGYSTRGGTSYEPHPAAYDFAVYYERKV